MTELASWLEGLLREVGVGPVDVMGHSMGCQVALALADQYPDRVRRVVLLGPTTGGRHVSALRNLAGLLADSRREPRLYNRLLTRIFWRMGPLYYLRTARAMQRDDAFEHAARIGAPTLVLQGERDAIIPQRAAEALVEVLQVSEYARIAGAHASQYSHPAPTADRVLAFLRDS
jgi:pimeloyl-ACP methyl ester carboxylesterase